MTRDQITQLIPLIPRNSSIVYSISATAWSEFYDVSGDNRFDLQAESWLLSDPGFVWKFCAAFSGREQRMPCAGIIEELYFEAERFLQDVNDYQRGNFHWDKTIHHQIKKAASLTSKNNAATQNVIDALLLLPDVAYEDIARISSLPVSTIKLYEQLFWNIRDRVQEETYIAQVTYPGHRKVELDPNYLYSENERNLIIRGARRHGVDLVRRFSGIDAYINELRAKDNAIRVEGGHFEAALLESQLGGCHGSYPGLTAARGLLQSENVGGLEKKGLDAQFGLEAVGVAKPVMATLMAMMGPSVSKMLQLEQEASDAAKIKNVGEKDRETVLAPIKPKPGWVEEAFEQQCG